MNDNTKLEIAKELVANMVGKAALIGLTLKDKELIKLINLKEEVDKGNMKAIDKVLSYGEKKRGTAND